MAPTAVQAAPHAPGTSDHGAGHTSYHGEGKDYDWSILVSSPSMRMLVRRIKKPSIASQLACDYIGFVTLTAFGVYFFWLGNRGSGNPRLFKVDVTEEKEIGGQRVKVPAYDEKIVNGVKTQVPRQRDVWKARPFDDIIQKLEIVDLGALIVWIAAIQYYIRIVQHHTKNEGCFNVDKFPYVGKPAAFVHP
jgi:hypothetical protein